MEFAFYPSALGVTCAWCCMCTTVHFSYATTQTNVFIYKATVFRDRTGPKRNTCIRMIFTIFFPFRIITIFEQSAVILFVIFNAAMFRLNITIYTTNVSAYENESHTVIRYSKLITNWMFTSNECKLISYKFNSGVSFSSYP